jgi:hypothetical protein
LENIRHEKALGSVISLETKRWATVLALHNRYKEEFRFLPNFKTSAHYQRQIKALQDLKDDQNNRQLERKLFRQESDETSKGLGRRASVKFVADAALDNEAEDDNGGDSVRRASAQHVADAVRKFIDKVNAPEPSTNLGFRLFFKSEPKMHQTNYDWPTLRILAADARNNLQLSSTNDITGLKLRESHGKLTSAIRLVQGYFLADVNYRRYGQSNYRILLKEVHQHDLRLATLQKQVKEPEIRLLLGDQALFHAAGWSEGNTRDTISIIQAGLLAWIGARQ